MSNKYYVLFLLVYFQVNSNAQDELYQGSVGILGSVISPGTIPFWFRSNQYGSVPLDGTSGSFTAAFYKEYHKTNRTLVDWGTGFDGRINLGHSSEFILVEGYGKVHLGVFEIRGGRSKEITGLCDSSLSSGSWVISGNALGIPKVQLSIPEFYSVPWFGELIAFKGNFAHGWFGSTPFKGVGSDVVIYPVTYLHQKALYGRFGKPSWRIKIFGGFNHQVMWGNEKMIYGNWYTLSTFDTYLNVITSKGYQNSRLGNSLGSIDLAIEYNFSNIRLFAYRQNFYEAGALYYLANIRDGLNGLSITNLKSNQEDFCWYKILVEFLYTKNQAGETWSKQTPSGDEDYFNNHQYISGWSYSGIGIGSPFISTKDKLKSDLPTTPNDYFSNNRVVVFHLGFEGRAWGWNIASKASYSLNYGTYGTSEPGRSDSGQYYKPKYGLFGQKKQFSYYMSLTKSLKHNLKVQLIGAFDTGELFDNSFGANAGIMKVF